MKTAFRAFGHTSILLVRKSGDGKTVQRINDTYKYICIRNVNFATIDLRQTQARNVKHTNSTAHSMLRMLLNVICLY